MRSLKASAHVLDELVRVLVGAHVQHLDGHAHLLQNGDGPQGRLDPRPVAVVGQNHLIRVALEHIGVLDREGGSQGGHRVGESGLVEGDHVQIPLADQKKLLPGRPGVVQPVEVAALVEKLGLGGV